MLLQELTSSISAKYTAGSRIPKWNPVNQRTIQLQSNTRKKNQVVSQPVDEYVNGIN